MPAFSDPIHFFIRAGTQSESFGDQWVTFCSAVVEHDRIVCLYGLSGRCSQPDKMAIAHEIKRLGRLHGWKGMRWVRQRKNNTVHDAFIPFTYTLTKSI